MPLCVQFQVSLNESRFRNGFEINRNDSVKAFRWAMAREPKGDSLRAEAVWVQVLECCQVAGEVAANSLNDMAVRSMEPGSPLDTCTVDMNCRNAAALLYLRHNLGPIPGPHLPVDQPLPRWQPLVPHFRKQHRSKHPQLLPTPHRRSFLPPGLH